VIGLTFDDPFALSDCFFNCRPLLPFISRRTITRRIPLLDSFNPSSHYSSPFSWISFVYLAFLVLLKLPFLSLPFFPVDIQSPDDRPVSFVGAWFWLLVSFRFPGGPIHIPPAMRLERTPNLLLLGFFFPPSDDPNFLRAEFLILLPRLARNAS